MGTKEVYNGGFFQDYVKLPIQIQFSSSSVEQTVSSSSVSIMEEQIIPDTNLEEGNFYCVVSDTEQGFEIVQCDVDIDSGFAGSLMQKCLEESADKFVFKES